MDAPTVLVVDDNEMLRALLGRILCAEGFRVSVAGSVEEALRLDAAAHDVLLIDLRLGGRSGADLIDELRRIDPAVTARCLVLTGAPGLDPVPAGLPVVTKPFTADELVAAVRGVLPADRGHGADRG
ncbi:response regulator [Frankia sp. QA3]|uniref:response regulator n=1 Tax=Frankia sp. QA3 TaxID=710111 RepID=UPI0012F7A8CA|nr:response regulator [Frankia sp. QA3]